MLVSLTSAASGAWQTREGYRGFVDLGGIIGTGDWASNSFTLSTTHGYQVIPSYLYVGAGIGMQINSGMCYLPLYADLRTQVPAGRIAPFFDMRFGYSGRVDGVDYNYGGLYLNPSLGITWTLSRKVGLEFAVGYNYQDAVVADVYLDSFLIGQVRKDVGGINFRLGITF